MLDKRHPLKWLLTGALLVLVVIAVVTSLLIVEQQRTLGRVSRYNLTWVISQAATETLRASGIMDGVIKVGSRLPAFTLPNANGVAVSSADLLAQGPLVLTVFRGHW